MVKMPLTEWLFARSRTNSSVLFARQSRDVIILRIVHALFNSKTTPGFEQDFSRFFLDFSRFFLDLFCQMPDVLCRRRVR